METLDNIVIVKVGTSTLTQENTNSNKLDHESFGRIGQQVLGLKESGCHVVLVSSGAVAAGMEASGESAKDRSQYETADLQRFASIGWRCVLNAWQDSLGDTSIGGLLLTRQELKHRFLRRNEAMTVAHNLLLNGSVAVANENDAISHEQIAFGDNDTLAANIAAKMSRSKLFGRDIKLVMLSDVDGVYEDTQDTSSVIREINDLDTYAHLANGSDSMVGTGGMRTKFDAGNIAMKHGVDMWIANGREDNAIQRAMNGEIGTRISSRIEAQRIAVAATSSGMV